MFYQDQPGWELLRWLRLWNISGYTYDDHNEYTADCNQSVCVLVSKTQTKPGRRSTTNRLKQHHYTRITHTMRTKENWIDITSNGGNTAAGPINLLRDMGGNH